MADLKEFAEQLVNLTVKEVSELADILKDEYGIEPAAAAAVAVASGPASGVFTKVNDPNNPITGSSSNSPVAGFTFDGSHDHTFNASGTSGNPSDTGTDAQGGSTALENRPPYYALCYIMKT